MALKRSPANGDKAVPPTERIVNSSKQLSNRAPEISSAAEELRNSIAPLGAFLRKLDLGVSAWHEFAGHEDEDGHFWGRDIGYTQVGKRWGIALRRRTGHNHFDHYEEEVWLFEEAPRWMQIESVNKIPELFEELIKRTDDTIKKLHAKASEAKDLAAALEAAVAEVEGW